MRKRNRVFLPGLGRTHAVRDELAAWLDAQPSAASLVDYERNMTINSSFEQVGSPESHGAEAWPKGTAANACSPPPRSPSRAQYLEVMSGYKFCLCPRGNGIDAHRVWECMLVGSVPIYVSNDPTPGSLHAIQVRSGQNAFTRVSNRLLRQLVRLYPQH